MFHAVGEQRDGSMISAVFEPKRRFGVKGLCGVPYGLTLGALVLGEAFKFAGTRLSEYWGLAIEVRVSRGGH